jgi:DNA-directed RNA polymerase subunit alpha
MINIPLAKKIEEKEISENKSEFHVGPLYPGFGLTLGNALRRVLLSSLGGAAIEAVKIDGVEHEFSIIDWVQEDVVDIILNLKQVRIKMSDELVQNILETGEDLKLVISQTGAKKITAGNFEKVSGIEIANPDLHLMTMTDKASKLELSVHVGYGLGYSAFESREDKNYEVGTIKMDASYSPVVRIGYDIENVRVGRVTNWDKIVMNIETDGTVDCKEAFDASVGILINQFGALVATQETKEKELLSEVEEKEEEEEKVKPKKVKKEKKEK